MAAREEILRSVIQQYFGYRTTALPILIYENLKNENLMDEVHKTYMDLGGISEKIPMRFGRWDITTEGFILELDEEQHFNRYRHRTLNSIIYRGSSWFDLDNYRFYCNAYEDNCTGKASFGKYWTSQSTEKQFGPPGPKGDLNGLGSPRWKQRAFYDYLRDVYAYIFNIPIIRLSIYDRITFNNEEYILNEILENQRHEFYPQIITFIEDLINSRI